MRRHLLPLFALFLAGNAGAQINRRGFTPPPTSFFSFGAALQDGFTLHDGATNSTWTFGESTQYTASLEKALTPGASLGIRGNMGRVPLTVRGASSGDADALVSQLLASLYLQSGGAIHTVVEGDVGATIYSGFTPRAGSTAVVPNGTDTDFVMTLGFGIGYSFSPRVSIDFVRTVGKMVHQKTGLSAGEDNSPNVSSLRFMMRLGLGQK